MRSHIMLCRYDTTARVNRHRRLARRAKGYAYTMRFHAHMDRLHVY